MIQPGVLVVGADGMVGRSLVERLRKTQTPVMGTTRRRDQVSAECLYLDLGNDLRDWQPPRPVNVAILCAGVTRIQACQEHREESARINVDGIAQLAEELHAAGAFVIYLSTNQVFNGSIPLRTAGDPTCPVTEYGRQKAAAEKRLSDAGSADAIVRFAKILEPGNPLFAAWIESLQKAQAIRPFSDMTFAPVPLSFAVDVLVRVAERRVRGIIQVSAEEDVSYEQAARYIARAIGAAEKWIEPIRSSARGGLPQAAIPYTSLDVSRLRAELHFSPPGVWAAVHSALPAQIDLPAGSRQKV